jgi:hypothetical protein
MIFFLVRNLFSMQTAQSIAAKLNNKNFIFSLENENDKYFLLLKKSFFIKLDECIFFKTEYDKNVFNIKNPIKSFFIIKKTIKKIEKIFYENNVTTLFVTYPIHPKTYAYIKVANKNKINICFYEEGICFYRKDTALDFKINSFKKIIKSILLCFHGLKMGYNIDSKCSYSFLDNQENELLFPEIILNEDYINLDVLILSRPMSNDYNLITLDIELNTIAKALKKLNSIYKIGIKFHPREGTDKRKKILYTLNKSYNVIEVESKYNAELIVKKMRNGYVLGYETSTLYYCNTINPNVKPISMLEIINSNIHEEKLSVIITEMREKFKKIKVLNGE